MSRPIEGQGGHLVFSIGPKNTNLVEDIEILLPGKFRWILFSEFRGKAKNVKVYVRRTPDGRADDAVWHKLTWAEGSSELIRWA